MPERDFRGLCSGKMEHLQSWPNHSSSSQPSEIRVWFCSPGWSEAPSPPFVWLIVLTKASWGLRVQACAAHTQLVVFLTLTGRVTQLSCPGYFSHGDQISSMKQFKRSDIYFRSFSPLLLKLTTHLSLKLWRCLIFPLKGSHSMSTHISVPKGEPVKRWRIEGWYEQVVKTSYIGWGICLRFGFHNVGTLYCWVQ